MVDKNRMTSRERILAALRSQPVDRIPFVPLIDSYTVMDMPREIIGDASGPMFDPMTLVNAARALGCDVMPRHTLSAVSPEGRLPHLESLGRFGSPISTRTGFDSGQLSETIETPVGSITARWKFTDKAGWIPHMVKPVVSGYEELKIFHYAVDHLESVPSQQSYDAFLHLEQEIGDEGIAPASVSNSPLMYLIEMAWGLENTYYLLQDHREEVEDILEKLHISLKRHVQLLAEGPAQVVIQYENTSSTLLSPNIFQRYCLPRLNEYADILMGAGKIFLVHMCGKLQAFVNEIAEADFGGIADIPPPPTGDLTLDDAKKIMPKKVVIGGIDPTTFLGHNAEPLEQEVAGLIERIKPYRGVLLGSADTAPRGTPPEHFQSIGELVKTVGAYT
jgi:uroporphyrinogen-III decarboxylase